MDNNEIDNNEIYNNENKFQNIEKKILEIDRRNKHDLKHMHPIDMKKQIDFVFEILNNFFNENKKKSFVKKIQQKKRIENLFGLWSHNFNKILRKRIKELELTKDKTQVQRKMLFLYKYVYSYWWNTYYCLFDKNKKKKYIIRRKRERLILKERQYLSDVITEQIDIDILLKEFDEKLSGKITIINNLTKKGEE